MLQLYSRLNAAVREFDSLGIARQFAFGRLYQYSIVTHSTAIEGSTISESENTLMFDEDLVPGGHNVTEQLMNLDLKRAYDYVNSIIAAKPDVNIDFLKHLASLVMRNTGSLYHTLLGSFDSSQGDLRLFSVSAGRGGRSYINYKKVPERLEEFCRWLNEGRKREFPDAASVYDFSFEAHYRLVTIHPWADGNGRTARLLMNMLQMEQGVLPSLVKKERKAEYIDALSAAQEADDSRIFVAFMLRTMTDFLQDCTEEFRKSN